MKRLIPFFALCALLCTGAQAQEANFNVIPAPVSITDGSGSFTLNAKTKIVYPEGDTEMANNAKFLQGYLTTATGQDHALKSGKGGSNTIVLALGEVSDNAEGYTLSVTSKQITITAPTAAGVFYGIQTLRKSLPIAVGQAITIPAVEISDAPRFAYRGASFDISRHFFNIDEVKTYIDMMTLHNMNRLHWHLTDDQGWRIEIKKYPGLTEIGSRRSETVIGHNSGVYDGTPHSGYFTQEEIKEVVAYAAERYITVVPEIDLPGHMQAALAAYPELGCTGGPYEVWRQWGISDDVLCAGNDQVLTFLEDVMSELCELFPSEYIHIGGDECPKVRWETCPKCQARIKAEGLDQQTDHEPVEALQSYVMRHVEKFLKEKYGRRIIGWDEILDGGVSPEATIMSWRGEEGGIAAAKIGRDVIMTPHTYLYLDYYQSDDYDNEPDCIGGNLPLSRVYSYEPMTPRLTSEEQKHIVGVQGNLWTEYIGQFAKVQYMVLPRWAALSEIQWSPSEKKDYDNFLTRLPQLVNWYETYGYTYAKHALGGKPQKTF